MSGSERPCFGLLLLAAAHLDDFSASFKQSVKDIPDDKKMDQKCNSYMLG